MDNNNNNKLVYVLLAVTGVDLILNLVRYFN